MTLDMNPHKKLFVTEIAAHLRFSAASAKLAKAIISGGENFAIDKLIEQVISAANTAQYLLDKGRKEGAFR